MRTDFLAPATIHCLNEARAKRNERLDALSRLQELCGRIPNFASEG